MSAARLELRGITKVFAGVRANDAIDLTVHPGEIQALLGENGAGKSTLVKIIYGVLHADTGSILWNNHPVHIVNPAAARRLGIGMVFQHFSLFDSLTVAENIALGLDEGRVPAAQLSERIHQLSHTYGLPLEPERLVHSLSAGERQRVEIVRCLLRDPSLLILDEPTSVLTPQEAQTLFVTLRQLASGGCSILYISHKLDEIRDLCHRATILRSGRVVTVCDPRTATSAHLARLMLGHALELPQRATPDTVPGPVRLAVSGLTVPGIGPFAVGLKDVSFEVHSGEIFGIGGVAGNGQSALTLALSGEYRTETPGMITLDGQPVGTDDPRQRRGRGLAVVPEERLGRGAIPDMSLTDNALLSGYGHAGLVRHGMVYRAAARDFARRIIARFQVVARGPHSLARALSGGNIQKFIVGREILQNPRILVVAQPTWGVDTAATAVLHRSLMDLARQGTAVLVISQDLDELLRLTDRLAVLCHGRLSPPLATRTATLERLGLLMGGLFDPLPSPVSPEAPEVGHGLPV